MTAAVDFEAPLREQCAMIWAATRAHVAAEQAARDNPPVVRLWDGEMRLQHLVQAEYGVDCDVPARDTGSIEVRHPFDHPVGQWLWDEQGRLERGEKRNVNITVDYCGGRFAGLIESIDLEGDASTGDQVVTARFATDVERLKWYTVYSNPFFPLGFQAPKHFLIGGPAPWVLGVMLLFQLLRENSSTFILPIDPLNLLTYGGPDMSDWPIVVKPLSFGEAMAGGSIWSVGISRFRNFWDVAKPIMEDAQIIPVTRRYLEGDPPPWPGANLRPGTIVVSFEDHSAAYTGTSSGGNIFDGLIRTVLGFAEDFIDSTEELASDVSIPSDYYIPGNRRQDKRLPIAVWRDTGDHGAADMYRLRKTPAKGRHVLTGGASAPGVNELVRATVQMIGDLTAMIPGVPPLGGVADALLSPMLMDVILAWMDAWSMARYDNSGWQQYFELFMDSGGKAYTLSSLMVLRAGFVSTKSTFTKEFSVGDGSPFVIGDQGVGHVWNGDRAGFTVRGERSGRIYLDTIGKLGLSWSRTDAVAWRPTIGDDRAVQDPVQRLWEKIETYREVLQQAGIE